MDVKELQDEINELRRKLQEKQHQLIKLKQQNVNNNYNKILSSKEISRYSRQILLPNIKVAGQEALKNSKVLIVGCGGLGTPCAMYLAAAGVGTLTLVDNDDVEISNLHRQILHNESNIGESKPNSCKEKLMGCNSNINIIPLKLHVNSSTIRQLFKENSYDVVVDGSDNVATRYLLNDGCVFNKIPLVSGSALKMEGQLTVYNYKGGLCYRCLFSIPPPPDTVDSCGDAGVLGPVCGTIGVLQALETIKILTNQPNVLAGRLLTFDATDTTFRNIKLRHTNKHCKVCGEQPEITDYIDYEQFCGARADDKVHNISILNDDENVSAVVLKSRTDNVVIDVRPELEYEMCHLSSTRNFPYDKLRHNDTDLKKLKDFIVNANAERVYVVCRRGNDSQRAIKCLMEKLDDLNVKYINVKGGLHSYAKLVDPTFPVY